jgi:hypothetical protein
VLALPLFAIVAIAFGKEAGWDFQNYHWYDPYALLNGRLGFDIAVAHHATYYNPYLDVPLYWLGTHCPAWVAGAWLGMAAGLAAGLLGAIAYRLMPFPDTRLRLGVAVLLALAGATGGGALGEIGMTSNDIASGLGVMAALLVLVARFDRVMRAAPRDLVWALGLAGFLAGLSPGLKLTTVPYVIALTLAIFTVPGTLSQRAKRAAAFAIGAGIGMAFIGGPWYWTMWRYSGNPVFPYFNDLFASKLVPPGSYRDDNYVPKTWFARLFFPFLFTQNPALASAWDLRDVHIVIAYVLVPVAWVAGLFKRPVGRPLVAPKIARLFLVMAAVTYLIWMLLFGIYRYLIPLEMLSPLIIVAAAARLPLPAGSRLVIMTMLLGGAAALSWKGDEPRFGWKGPYVQVDVPKIADPAHALVLMTETAPMAYVIPSFPHEIPFLRISGWMVGSTDNSSMLGAEMHRRIADHQGPLYALYWPREAVGTYRSLADYGLRIEPESCQKVRTNVESANDLGFELMFCPLKRISP